MATTVTLDSSTASEFGGSVTSGTLDLTTSGPNRLAVLMIGDNGQEPASISSVTATGLVWTRQTHIIDGGLHSWLEIWTAPILTEVTDLVVTIDMSQATNFNAVLDTYYLTAGATYIPSISTVNSAEALANGTDPTTVTMIYDGDHIASYAYNSQNSDMFTVPTGFSETTSTAGFAGAWEGALSNNNTPTAGTTVTLNWTQTYTADYYFVGWIVFNGLLELPEVPTELSLSVASSTQINVIIPALSGGATSYNLQRALDSSGSPGTYITLVTGVTPATTYNDTGLTEDTIYWYRLVAVNAYGSTNGLDNSIMELYGTPGVYSTQVINDTIIHISIPTLASVAGALSFNLQRAPNSAGSPGAWSTIATGITPNAIYVDNTCYANTIYYYRLVAVDMDTNINGSTMGPLLTAPGQPTGISLVGATSGEAHVTINFTEATDAVYTNIYRSTSSGGIYTLIGETSISSYTDFAVTSNTNYYYKFTSTNSNNNTGAIGNASGPISSGGFSGMTLERSNIYEGSQIGPETTPGVVVAATHRLMNTSFMPDIAPDIKDVRTDGEKFDTDVAIGKEYTSGKTSGKMAYPDLVYLFASLCTSPTISTPANNSTWVISGATGTIGFTFENRWGVSATLAPATYANAAALQTALQGLASIGVGNVKVTGAEPVYTVQFIGALSTDTSVPTVAGAPDPTIAPANVATNTRRFSYLMNPWGPENSIQTYTLEKGIPGIANYAQQIAQLTMTGLQLRMTKDDASETGDFVGTSTIDPFTMTALTDTSQLPSVVINPKDIGVYAGTSLFGANGVARLSRVFEMEWGVTGRYAPIMTLDDSIPSFSNTVETTAQWTQKMTMAQDAYGQAQLANLRASQSIYRVIEAKGPAIETGFPYRFKITEHCKLTAAPKADSNGVYSGAYESRLIMDNLYLNGAFLVEIDTGLTAIN